MKKQNHRETSKPQTGSVDMRLGNAAHAGRGQLRLAISIPALMILFTLAYGLTSYQLFSSKWTELEAAGAGDVARSLLQGHLYTMIVMAVLALAMGSGLAVAILKPIRAINETARMIARGRIEERAPLMPASVELGDLSRSFNFMIDFLNNSIQERNRYLAEGIASGILIADMGGRITALNRTGALILGIDRAEVIGQTADGLRDHGAARWEPFWDYLKDALRNDQTQTPDEVVLSAGPESVSILVAMSFLRDPHDIPRGIILNFRDAGEIRSLNEQLSKTDQLAALGTFTMGLAHELRNPLGSIKGIIQLLKLKGTSSELSRQYLDRVVDEVDRLDGFVRDLLDFSNQSPTPAEWADLNEVLRTALALGRSEAAGKDIKVIEDFESIPEIFIEADRIAQAFAHIIRNDFEVVPEGGRITLQTRIRIDDVGHQVVVRIHNSGTTISTENRTKIFDPFFTTKEKGSGLGLAIAYQIIAQNQGSLDLAVGPNEVTFIARFRIVERVQTVSPNLGESLACPGKEAEAV